jgi:MFS family permease
VISEESALQVKDRSLGAGARAYAARLRQFQPNARLYLANVVVGGLAMGIFRLLFSFFVLSLGYDEALLGQLVTTSSLTSLAAALPMGYLADRLGRKGALLAATALMGLSIVGMVAWPAAAALYAANIISGVAQSLAAVSNAPFLVENSGESERTYLFSFSAGLQMAAVSAGSWIGGYLPTWAAAAGLGPGPTSSQAYGAALLVTAALAVAALAPLALLRPAVSAAAGGGEPGPRPVFAPITYARRHPGLLARLILPMLITSIGAGLIMPFLNVFFRVQHGQPDPVIGALFAWGALAMGAGLLVAPPLAERLGKIQLVVLTQALSIPFLIALGFAPLFWVSAAAHYVRLALMNMSSPVYQTFVMEQVGPEARATAASLASMAWNFGWAFSPTISGWLQVRYGFGPAFAGTIVLYALSTGMYWAFFGEGWRGRGLKGLKGLMSRVP